MRVNRRKIATFLYRAGCPFDLHCIEIIEAMLAGERETNAAPTPPSARRPHPPIGALCYRAAPIRLDNGQLGAIERDEYIEMWP